jgi:hypothetical protein
MDAELRAKVASASHTHAVQLSEVEEAYRVKVASPLLCIIVPP